MFFKYPYFKFNGKSSRDFQLRLCEVGSSSSQTSPFGVSRTIEKDTTSGFTTKVKSITYSDTSFDITLIKTDGNIPLPITEPEKFEIISWLFQDEFKPLISEDDESKIYYAIFTKGSSYQNGLKQGYINLTVQLNAPCAFSPIQTGYFTVEGETFVDLVNQSNVGMFIEPDFEFQLKGDATSFKIENLNTGDVMSFEGLPVGSHIQCYNEGMKQAISITDPDLTVRRYMIDKAWIRLAKGKNRLRITSEFASVSIIGQARLALS